jgi:hypothetical protein
LVAALQVGLLAVLDYRDWARRQVSREAVKLDSSLTVSCSLELSSEHLQDQYCRWMDQIPAVRWHPLAVFVAQAAFLAIPVVVKLEGGCIWRVDAGRGWMTLPGPSLVATRVAMQAAGAPKWAQSLSILLSQGCILATQLALLTLNDTCFVSIAPGWSSASGMAAFAAVYQVTNLSMGPCTMKHLDLQIGTMALANVSMLYLKHLKRVGSGELSVSSDPGLLYFRSIAIAVLAVLLAGKFVRYWIAMTQMTSFLRLIRSAERREL